MFAFGYLGLTSEDFWNSTPREFNNRIEGFLELQQFNQRMEWERCRWATCLIIQPNVKKRLKPTDLIKSLLKDNDTHITKGDTFENRKNILYIL